MKLSALGSRPVFVEHLRSSVLYIGIERGHDRVALAQIARKSLE